MPNDGCGSLLVRLSRGGSGADDRARIAREQRRPRRASGAAESPATFTFTSVRRPGCSPARSIHEFHFHGHGRATSRSAASVENRDINAPGPHRLRTPKILRARGTREITRALILACSRRGFERAHGFPYARSEMDRRSERSERSAIPKPM
jgi:hypothetical protein